MDWPRPQAPVPGVAGQEVQDVIVQADGAGADGEAHHLGRRQGRLVELPEGRHRRIGIGKALEIGDEPGRPVAPGQAGYTRLHLSRDALPPPPGAGPGTPGIAVEAPPGGHPAVPVGAGQPGIQGDFLDPLAEPSLQV